MPDLKIAQGREIRNAEAELKRFRARLAVASGFVVVLFVVLILRFFYLQVIQHAHYHTLAEANRIAIVPIPPNRGLIFDRNGVVLARNYAAYTLEITPSKVANLNATLDRLSKIIDITPHDRRRFKKLMEDSRPFESLPIRTRLTDEEIARFAANGYRFPGVQLKARLLREYPQGALFSHVVGYVGRINQHDLDELEKEGRLSNYRGTEYIGKTGLERSYERYLHGTTGFEEVEVDSTGHAVRTLKRVPPIAGANVVLNLDAGLQAMVYHAFGDHDGALVAIDPATGGVLAFVSKPGFNPNLFVDGIDPQNWNELNKSPDRPLLDRALDGLYAPGSTFKPYLALAALHDGKRTPQFVIHDPGFFSFGGHIFHDDKPGGHGIVDMHKALVVSCDTYFYMLAHDLGIDAIARFVKQFGFGSRTGIDIPGEAAGVLPSKAWKWHRFHQKWYPGETISIGIGQGYNAYTPLQLANAITTLANNGVMYRPHLVDYIEDMRTHKRIVIAPEVVRRIKLKPQYYALVKSALVGVDNSKEGTAWRAFVGTPYVSAGKTGTAQVFGLKKGERYVAHDIPRQLRDNALFVSYAPAADPKIALAVVVEHAGYGGSHAAPIARDVFDYYLLGKKPEEPARHAAPAH